MARRKYKKKKLSIKSVLLSITFLIVSYAGYYIYTNYIIKPEYIAPTGELEFHFLTLGNGASGDCIFIKAGENDILIDGGSDTDSLDDIKNYVDARITDNKLEYVILTHADNDHIACFGGEAGQNSLFDLYEVETIIDFPQTEKNTQIYQRYVSERTDEINAGAKHFTALECYNESKDGAKRVFELSNDGNIKIEILYNYYYENDASVENDYSVCVLFHHGSRQFLFTGDLEEKGEEKLAAKYDFTQVELFKAGHHGSSTSSNESLLKEIKPKICVVTCAIGDKYDFPTQDFLERISVYTSQVYVTTICTETGNGYADMNGNIVVISSADRDVYVQCSNNQTLLKDTTWIDEFRQMPTAWK